MGKDALLGSRKKNRGLRGMSINAAHSADWVVAPTGVFAAFLSVLGLVPAIVGTIAAIIATIYYIILLGRSPEWQQWRRKRKLDKIEKLRTRILILQQALGVTQLESREIQTISDNILTTETHKKIDMMINVSPAKPTREEKLEEEDVLPDKGSG
jgi:hypothetical protein